ncbi:hypothetical protein ACP_1754 [Acidobacterium capsulatum ATCC 51196]|uniref:Uncharacterized protein n=1 Tax=Acidobacterium capsulatum (strain ATCC 51196 / DSM 11244 / BCRC 80197 / JCM 7670 / NBRC 15755 / NCIMB 13165 / 161) TaxID=240015 RepID=C1F7M3_ACIC5|nr:hypothetical protein ACP_1754 [Acidobacterium capsulatum ATCC 51196]
MPAKGSEAKRGEARSSYSEFHSWPGQRDCLLQRKIARYRLQVGAHRLLLPREALEKEQLAAEVELDACCLPVRRCDMLALDRERTALVQLAQQPIAKLNRVRQVGLHAAEPHHGFVNPHRASHRMNGAVFKRVWAISRVWPEGYPRAAALFAIRREQEFVRQVGQQLQRLRLVRVMRPIETLKGRRIPRQPFQSFLDRRGLHIWNRLAVHGQQPAHQPAIYLDIFFLPQMAAGACRALVFQKAKSIAATVRLVSGNFVLDHRGHRLLRRNLCQERTGRKGHANQQKQRTPACPRGVWPPFCKTNGRGKVLKLHLREIPAKKHNHVRSEYRTTSWLPCKDS